MFDNSVNTYLILLLTVIALQLLFTALLVATLVYTNRLFMRELFEKAAEYQKKQLEDFLGDDEDEEVDPLDSHFETVPKD